MSTAPISAPVADGFRWPAEWEPHEATWLSWPHNPETWPGERLARVEAAYVEMVRALVGGERVRINVLGAAAADRVAGLLREGGVDPTENVDLLSIPTDDAWVRDYGPIFQVATLGSRRCGVVFGFNSWGGKYPPFDRDAAAGARMAEARSLPRYASDQILEGGSIDGDGQGTVLTTERCLLHPNRGPDGRPRSREAMEALLAGWVGARHVIWLEDGIAGDDTDGHVDDFARFVAPGVVVHAVEPDPSDANHAALTAATNRLAGARDAEGRALDLVPMPMPAPLHAEGQRLPASHANFYIANQSVLVPVFGGPSDERACSILAEHFPDRKVVGIPAADLVYGLGAVHCLTQQEPASPDL